MPLARFAPFAFTFGILSAPLAADAQQPTKVPTIGMLLPVPSADAATNIEAFRQGLHEPGYVEGQNVAYVLWGEASWQFPAGRHVRG